MTFDPRLLVACALIAGGSVGCGGSDPTGSGGTGVIAFTTWGEEYIEREIPADPGDGSGFVDGWTVRFDEFLVNFQNIVVADASGRVAAQMKDSLLFDNHVAGVKPIVEFEGVEAKAWNRISYEIAPVTVATKRSPEVSAAEQQLMLDGGFSLYASGTASKGEVVKSFAWGFALGTRYSQCHSESDGRDEEGVVLTNNGLLEVELTTHGDHFFYDRLQASPDPSVASSPRFDGIAAADADDNGEVTLEELDAQLLDVTLYNPSGFDAATLGDFVKSLSRTVGHFRGEGECTVSNVVRDAGG